MQVSLKRDQSRAIVKLAGRFDFNTHREFRAEYEPCLGDGVIREVVVDLSDVDYLDSSALGMLLMLRDKANTAGKSVALIGVKGSVKQVLDIANFAKLFSIA
ncbi:MAG: hypothetical protein RIR00_1177 [Pseudomonadota bacterium]|jgi:anti-anti-sigma factor